MAAYYHTTEIPDHSGLHTVILMNPTLPDHTHHQPPPPQPPPPQPPSSRNILLLNSAPPPLPDNITLYGYPPHQARDIPRARQGLSLSLSSQHPLYGARHNGGADVACGGGGQVSVVGSKYLKAAQELLEEVVHVGDGVYDQSPKKPKPVGQSDEERENHGGGGAGGGGGQLSTAERQEIQMKKAKLAAMLDEAEQRYRQYNHQMQIIIESFEQAAGIGSAKTYTALALKTISKQFRCLKDAIQAQIRAANKSLGEDQGGGSGSGSGSGPSGGKIEGSRLKFIDHQIRQQRALQQLGMIQNPNAWRPQRGLPERSVSVLRAWLFEHFLHPYPKDSDKVMLAKQTGLTRSQVSNWFINARVRLWKPMIEDMYKEEIKEQEQNVSDEKPLSSKENSSNEDNHNAAASKPITNQEKINTIAIGNQIKSLKDQPDAAAASSSLFIPMIPANPPTLPFKANNNNSNNNNNNSLHPQNQHGLTLNNTQGSPKRQRSYEVDEGNGEIIINFGSEKQGGRDHGNVGYPLISGGMNFVGGGELGLSYPIGDMGRFETEDFSSPNTPTPTSFLHGNGISLSLGLPPSCDNHHHQQQQINTLSATTSHTFLPHNQNIQFRRSANDFSSMGSPSSHSSAAAAFDCIDIQNRKGFAAQLLPDFVA